MSAQEIADVLGDRLHVDGLCRSHGVCQCAAAGADLAEQVEALIVEREAVAWRRGYVAGHSNAMRRMSDEPNAPTSPNPYSAPTAHATAPLSDQEPESGRGGVRDVGGLLARIERLEGKS